MRLSYLVAAAALLILPSVTRAQVSGFGGASAFEPEIDVVNSGVLLDVQATVSADRKYVTMTMRPQNAQLLALRSFTFQSGGPPVNGAIGGGGAGVGAGGGAVGGTSGQTTSSTSPSGGVNAPVAIAPGAGPRIMGQRGITPIDRK